MTGPGPATPDPAGPDQPLCRQDDIPDGQARGFTVPLDGIDTPILIARRGDRLFGYRNACPHIGVPLDWAPDRFMTADGTALQCALHGAQFAVESGQCLWGPPRGRRLTAVALQLDADGAVRLATMV